MHHLSIATSGHDLLDITDPILRWVAQQRIQTQLSIPVEHGRPVLGTWQGIYVFEHRSNSRKRELILHLLGE